MATSLLLILLGGTLLFFGGEALVRGATALGLRLGLSPLVVGLTIVAFGTSSPELAVSLNAALDGLSDVAIGNVVGSNIFNIAAVLGMVCLIRPMRVQSQIVRLDAPIAVGAALLLVALLADRSLSQLDGALLAVLLLGYIGLQLRLSLRGRDALAAGYAGIEGAVDPRRPAWVDLALAAAGVGILVLGAKLFVDGAVTLARLLGIREAVIGLTILAVGTSLPELATSLVAAVRKEADVAIGNAIGSNIFNVFSICGFSALLTPLEQGGITAVDLWVMVAFSALLWPVLYTGLKLTRFEGGLLFAGYLAYTAWLVATA